MSPLFTLRYVTTESLSFIQCLSWWRYCDESKNKAIHVICNAQVKCYSNTINLWKHLISRMISAMNEWRMARRTVFFYLSHTKARTTLAVFSSSAVSLYDDINTRISSPAAQSHFISILLFNLRNLPSYHIHSSCKFLTATRQNKSLV